MMKLSVLWLLSLVAGNACSFKVPYIATGTAPPAAPCLPGERGFLRIGLRGAIDRDLDWRGAQLQCEGGARPAGNGLRVSFSGATVDPAMTLRIVFGIAAPPGASASGNLPTNITVIVEGGDRLYATQGDDKCQVESMVQQALYGASTEHAFRVAARGYCIGPASTLDGSAHLYINRFDFAGVARFEESDLHAH
jgi:hypothetical protein